jgi:hypothetical protein
MSEELASLRDLRHIDKSLYLGSHDMFYELNYNHYRPSDELLSIVEQIFPQSQQSWRAMRDGVWTHVMPLATETEEAPPLLKQGWKIHVSATNTNCADILRTVASLLIPRRTQFKFANDIQTLCLMTSKRWPRGGSGKFITIYPRSVEDFRSVIEEVYQALKGFRGSYILSDRRYKDSNCVYYRFGGILATKKNDAFGRSIEVLTAPDGTQVVDKRNPFYELPYWLDEVFPDEPEPDAEEMSLGDGRFAIESALSFSNTGGVYLALDNQTGERVVVKEARPGVELGMNGEDATTRLAHEADILKAMEDSGVTPKVVTTFQDWENFYLAEEYLEAYSNMRRTMLEHSPLLKVNASQADRDKFYAIYKSIFVSLLNAVAEFHKRGIIIGDLSPMNILVEDDTNTVKIIDLEGAFHSSSGVTQEIHTPGFRPHVKGRKKESDYRDDLYAVGAIMMYSMFPIAALAFLREDVFERVLPVIVEDIGWSHTPVLAIIRQLVDGTMECAEAASMLEGDAAPGVKMLRPANMAAEAPIADLCRGLGRFIVSHWRADPAYTLFPIDPYGQLTNPAGFFLGSSGIVWALTQAGIDIPGDAMQRYRTELSSANPNALPSGLLTGTAGMAWALLEMGDLEQATRFLASANGKDLEQFHHSLYYGLAGLGLTNIVAYRRTNDDEYLRRATLIGEALERSARSDERGVYWEDSGGIRLGFGYGQSGVALFLLRLSQVSGEAKWRELGRRAVEFDLSHGLQLEPGITSFGGEPDHRGTLLPYIEQGSGGIAKVAMRYGLWDNLDSVISDVHRKYSGFPGLVFGLTGFLDVLTDAQRYSGDEKYGVMAKRPLQGLRDLYLFDTPQGLAAPGENLFRISCDYATGLAGMMYALDRHAHLRPDSLTLDWLDEEATSRERVVLAGAGR